MHRLALLAVIALSAAACGRPPEQAEPEPKAAQPAPAPTGVQRASSTPLKPLTQKKFGSEITEKSSTPLDQIVRHPGQFSARTVRTEGVVSAVCKSMGCWMELADDAGLAHIKMAGHSFFVPKDSTGHRAVIQGKVVRATPEGDDCAEEAKQQTGQVAKVEIEATGVEFID
jgi:hypothetical protein